MFVGGALPEEAQHVVSQRAGAGCAGLSCRRDTPLSGAGDCGVLGGEVDDEQRGGYLRGAREQSTQCESVVSQCARGRVRRDSAMGNSGVDDEARVIAACDGAVRGTWPGMWRGRVRRAQFLRVQWWRIGNRRAGRGRSLNAMDVPAHGVYPRTAQRRGRWRTWMGKLATREYLSTRPRRPVCEDRSSRGSCAVLPRILSGVSALARRRKRHEGARAGSEGARGCSVESGVCRAARGAVGCVSVGTPPRRPAIGRRDSGAAPPRILCGGVSAPRHRGRRKSGLPTRASQEIAE
ncbi:hypothetical protein C8J57DRAFT_1312530 [Mycena rebaudengoi]|nr:hypothetical protein C8J57DRAFT_1312530 [Mycena rebaudengoi]